MRSQNKFLEVLERIFGIDLRSLAVFRIGLAAVYLADLITRSRDLSAFYTDQGLLPRAAHFVTYQDPWIFSLNMASGSTSFQILLFLFAALAGIALLVGYRSRLACVLSWLMILSLDARNPLILGEGVFIRVFLFWGMFLPLGERYSLDSRLRSGDARATGPFLSIGTFALLFQIAMIYFSAGLHKLGSQGWIEGSALFSSLHYDPLTKPFGYFLARFKELTRVLTYASIGSELAGSLLLFSPLLTVPIRLIVLGGFAVMLIGFFVTFELGPLTWTMLVGLAPFLPGSFWDFVLRSPSRSGQQRAIRSSPWMSGLAGLMIVYVTLSNVFSFSAYTMPGWARHIGGSLLWMDQNWTMFAPPPHTGGWNVIEGRQRKGTSVDLLAQGRPVSWERPPLISATFKSQLWRKYWMRILNTGYEIPRAFYAQYLCREWNGRHEGMDQLTDLEIFQMQTELLPHYQITGPQKVSYGKYSC